MWLLYWLSALGLFYIGFKHQPFSQGELDRERTYYSHSFLKTPSRYPVGIIETADEICPTYEYSSQRGATIEMRAVAREIQRRSFYEGDLVRTGTLYELFHSSDLIGTDGECRLK
ncbi:hypothetical protein ACFSM5_14585 [Lacibacterium aquatile]|uniref:Uncharacterized protein n=1 Tax=Lacibacterium aquatile TaxID=1168082 RepID=A0ABW5DTE3_9PROT